MVESVLSGQVLLHRHKRLAFEYVPLVAPIAYRMIVCATSDQEKTMGTSVWRS